MQLDANNLYGWSMSKKLPVNDFKQLTNLSKFNESFIKNYDENSNKDHILEVDVTYPKNVFNLHKDLSFLSERERERERAENCKKLVCNIKDKEKYIVHIRALKQALNHGLILKRVHRVIQFN